MADKEIGIFILPSTPGRPATALLLGEPGEPEDLSLGGLEISVSEVPVLDSAVWSADLGIWVVGDAPADAALERALTSRARELGVEGFGRAEADPRDLL